MAKAVNRVHRHPTGFGIPAHHNNRMKKYKNGNCTRQYECNKRRPDIEVLMFLSLLHRLPPKNASSYIHFTATIDLLQLKQCNRLLLLHTPIIWHEFSRWPIQLAHQFPYPLLAPIRCFDASFDASKFQVLAGFRFAFASEQGVKIRITAQ